MARHHIFFAFPTTLLTTKLTPLSRAWYRMGIGLPVGLIMATPAVAAPILTQPTTVMDKLIVTATKTPTLTRNTVAQATVIDQDTLQRYQGQSVLDVLRGQGSVVIQQYGGDGSASNVSLRGYDSKRVLVLIDGIRYGSVSYGGSSLSLIPADQIDRIEILHGASGSSLYGSDAMGGVIQLFTKGQSATQSTLAVTLGAGTQESYTAQLSGQWVQPTTSVSVATGINSTAGINAVKAATGADTDKDGFESKNASLVVKHQLNDQFGIGGSVLYANSSTDIDYGDHQTQQNGAGNIYLDYQADKLSANVKYGQSVDDMDAYATPTAAAERYNTKQRQVTAQLGYQLPVGQLIGGAEHLAQDLDVSNPTSYQVKQRTINSGFVGYQLTNDRYDAQANVRHDRNSQFGDATTYSLGGAYRLSPNTRIGGSYATGFRAPAFNDLYGYAAANPDWGSTGYQGNPNLKVETSRNGELFVENSNASQTSRLTGYRSKLNDGLFYQYNTDRPSTTVNQQQATIQGINVVSDWHINHSSFGVNYDYQQGKDENDKTLKAIPKHKGLVYVGYQQPNYDVRAEWQHVGETNVDGYSLLNVASNYYVNSNLKINARLNNLTNKTYETYKGYRQKCINGLLSLTYQWF